MDDSFPGAPAPAPDGLKAWAAADQAPPEDRLGHLIPGEVDGTVRHPFSSEAREAYLEMIKGRGSIARRTPDAPIALVSLRDLVGIQETVNRERLVAHLRDPRMNDGLRGSGHGGMIDRPIVVRVGGRLWIHDGHHRLTAAHLRGLETAKVRFVDLDAEASP